MVNVPIVTDKLAVRLVALQRVDAGYLNNTLLGEKGSNDLRVRGLRGSIVFTPTETTRISALSMYQEYDLDDQTYVLFGPPKTFDRATNVAEFQDTQTSCCTACASSRIWAFATLTAIGSYTEKKADLAFDNSIFGGNDPRTNTPALASSNGKSKTEYGELRLASPDGGVSAGWSAPTIRGCARTTPMARSSTGLPTISTPIQAQFGGQSGARSRPATCPSARSAAIA
jgi:iron complex outermembrane receptor protein